ncbi:MAG: DUF3109 family protein [Bacteroidales bacterium]
MSSWRQKYEIYLFHYLCGMKVIDNTIVPEELTSLCFACDIEQCKGACCVEGDAGAPLTEEEISLLEDYIERIIPYMEEPGKEVVKRYGVFDWDMDGNYVTPLVNDRECAFAWFTDDGIALCAIEKAWEAGDVPLQKPESCHLYPLRLTRLENGLTKMVYHRWPICNPALENGEKKGIRLVDFLKAALTRKYGAEWREKLKVKR